MSNTKRRTCDYAVIIINSTPHSKRLPKKCFKKIAGKPVLEHIFDRISSLGIETFLAVPKGTAKEYRDTIIIPDNIKIMEGRADSPLHRTMECLFMMKHKYGLKPEYIIRITHDDILIDSATVEMLLWLTIRQKAGYGITPGIVNGAGVEVISVENIYDAIYRYRTIGPIEHISYFVKGPGCPNPKVIKAKARESISRPYRLTLDYPEDHVVLEAILRDLGPTATIDSICKYIDEYPGIMEYNLMPEVTIYTCVKDGERWIQPTMGDVPVDIVGHEYIIIDDGSTDKTLKKVLEVAGGMTWSTEKNKFKIIVNKENIGLASSSNKAIQEARGDYIIRIDCDDHMEINAIEKMRNVMEAQGAVICYANYNEIDENGNITRKNVDAREHHHIGCALVQKRWLNEIRFKEGIRHWDGLELYNRIKGRFQIAYVDEPLWYYRVHKNSMSRTNLEERASCKP